MIINQTLVDRSSGVCELCNTGAASREFTVSPKEEKPANQVALCEKCLSVIDDKTAGFHWRCLEGSIWNPEPAVQALSYRILQQFKDEDWAENLISSVDLDEGVVQWAMSAYEVPDIHTDAFGNKLENGDTVVLTKMLNVKGTSFSASVGTVVKKIKLVNANTEQIEGKINDQTIVILTKYVKKSF